MILVLCMLFSGVSAVTAAGGTSFQDVPGSHWASKYVDDVVSRNLFAGTGETTFGPEVSMNRAMFVTVLSRLANAQVDNNASTKFTDVEAGQWYTGAVAWAVSNDIVSGVSETSFAPEAAITREQMAALIVRYADYAKLELKEVNGGSAFKDEAAISAYALDPVKKCQKAGLISGFEDGSFGPQGTASRAQVAVIISLLVSGVPDTKTEEDGEKATFTVTFDSNGGSKVEAQEVKEGEKAVKPANPKKSEYSFGGWYEDKDLKNAYDFNSVVTKNITLYAKWTAVTGSGSSTSNKPKPTVETFTVTFDAPDASVVVGSKKVTESNVAKGSDLTFKIEANENKDVLSVVAGSTELYADENGNYKLENVQAAVVVKITCGTVEEAASAKAVGDAFAKDTVKIVKLTSDLTVSEAISVPEGKVLDGAGKKITYEAATTEPPVAGDTKPQPASAMDDEAVLAITAGGYVKNLTVVVSGTAKDVISVAAKPSGEPAKKETTAVVLTKVQDVTVKGGKTAVRVSGSVALIGNVVVEDGAAGIRGENTTLELANLKSLEYNGETEKNPTIELTGISSVSESKLLHSYVKDSVVYGYLDVQNVPSFYVTFKFDKDKVEVIADAESSAAGFKVTAGMDLTFAAAAKKGFRVVSVKVKGVETQGPVVIEE